MMLSRRAIAKFTQSRRATAKFALSRRAIAKTSKTTRITKTTEEKPVKGSHGGDHANSFKKNSTFVIVVIFVMAVVTANILPRPACCRERTVHT